MSDLIGYPKTIVEKFAKIVKFDRAGVYNGNYYPMLIENSNKVTGCVLFKERKGKFYPVSVGFAVLNPSDHYSLDVGIQIAVNRAVKYYFDKSLRGISHNKKVMKDIRKRLVRLIIESV